MREEVAMERMVHKRIGSEPLIKIFESLLTDQKPSGNQVLVMMLTYWSVQEKPAAGLRGSLTPKAGIRPTKRAFRPQLLFFELSWRGFRFKAIGAEA
jgi:hypothetical protein